MSQDVIEIPCPGCGSMQRIPEQSVPKSGEVACADCGMTISFRAAPSGVTGAIRIPGSVLPPPPSAIESITEARFDALNSSFESECQVISCPACGHSFDPVAAAAQRTVLVVEDTDFFLHLATGALSAHYRTIGVKSAAEARKVLATRPIDLVVLDLTLPDAEGSDVLRSLPRHDIPVLIYTSRDETNFIGQAWQQLQRLGARDVVHKGLNVEDVLLRKAQDLLDGVKH